MDDSTEGTSSAYAGLPDVPAEHFQDLEQQKHAAQLGMWIFLIGEILLFSAMFTLYAAYRARYPNEFAEAAGHTVLWMGSTGTVVLLLGSFFVALSIHDMREGRRRRAERLLWATALSGLAFLTLKFWEWAIHFREGIVWGRGYHDPELPGPGAQAFFNLYYVMTGAHALHVLGGIALVSLLALGIRRGRWDATYHVPHELGGMYWHLVDLIWLFLWPFFYLLR